MEYRCVKASEIIAFARQVAESGAPVLPVTPWRARSQAENPDALPGDTLLIVAYDADKKTAGYIGILPFRPAGKAADRIYWNTCWWVAPGAGASVSLSLFSKFLEETGKRVVFSDMTEKTAEILQRLKGYRMETRSGVMMRFRHAYQRRIINSKNSRRILKILASTGVPGLADLFLNSMAKRRMNQWLRDHPAPCTVRICGELTADHVAFATEHTVTDFTVPSIERFSWWRKFPWLVSPERDAHRIADRYYFSSLAKQNDLFVVECLSNESLVGVAILSNRDGVMKTQYLYYRHDGETSFFLSLLRHLLVQSGAHTLITFHEAFAGFVRSQSLPAAQIREFERYTGFSESILDVAGINGKLQDGDGDYIFT